MSTIKIPIPFMSLVEDDTRDARYAICKSCEFFTAQKTCEKCQCIMPVKTVWADSECPIGKWAKVTDSLP